MAASATTSKESKDGTKIVIRLLPPVITEEEFLATVPAVHKERMLWRRFHKGKRYKAEAKPSRNSLCYVQFDTVDHAEKFLADYHGHPFIDDKGESFRAVCCLSPYQKVPSKNRRSDNREGSIAEDAFFVDFQEQLAGPKGEYVPPVDPKTLKPSNYGDTPLLNFMLSRANDRKKRAEKRARRWEEEGYRARKWRCAECGTSKRLEEDPNEGGVFYCLYCWEYWEYADTGKKKKKKSKKAGKDEEWEEGYAETSKKKKKKKAEDEWWEGYAEEDTTKKKKKKKAAEDEWWEAPSTKDKGWSEAAWSGKDGWGEAAWYGSKGEAEERKPRKGRKNRGDEESKWKVKSS